MGKWDGTIRCELLVIPNAPFVHSWRRGHDGNVGCGARLGTIFASTLKKTDGGTRLRLVHSGFVLPRKDSVYRNMSGGWSQVVPRIGAIPDEQDSREHPAAGALEKEDITCS